MMDIILAFDVIVTRFLQSFQAPWLTEFMRVVSFAGDMRSYFYVVPVLAVFLYLKRFRFHALVLMVVTAGNLVHGFLKVLIARPRPSSDLVAVLGNGNGFSFPSGHAFGALIFYGLLIYFALTVARFPCRRLFIYGSAVFIVLVGVSRIYLGAHWFSDVLAGYLLGAVWLGAVIVMYNRFNQAV